MTVKTIVAAGAATSAAALSMVAMAPSATAAEASPDAAANVLDCTTYTPDGRTGTANCTNNTNRTIAFRSTVVCGMGLDATGAWLTLPPGTWGTSSGICPELSTGVGSVNWEEG
ncbi:hypothetical protein [Streptomyces montanus]|nr:hypothetical protein [Streptomyces montanus]